MSEHGSIRLDRGDDGVAVLTIDDPDNRVNTFNPLHLESMDAALDELEADDELSGVIVTSGKDTFFVGADLDMLSGAGPDDAEQVAELTRHLKDQLRRLETLGVPTVAALNGTALGGGLEIALACHHRIAVDRDDARFGFPEVRLGLLPGGGGVVRTTRMLGVQAALMGALVEGQRLRPDAAVDTGLVDEVVDADADVVAAAREWIEQNPDVTAQPWEADDWEIPGGTPSDDGDLAEFLPAIPATLRKETNAAPMPAPHHIMCASVESTQVDLDTALEIETSYFVDLVTSQVADNMTQAFFYDLEHVNKGGSRPDDVDDWEASRVAVLGAGMMGAGIAYVCAYAGMDVVLKDVDEDNAREGRQHSAEVLDRRVEQGKLDRDEADEILDRIEPTADPADLAGCDLVIEAVFEDLDLKHDVYAETEPQVADDALLCSNTSSLPITELAEGVDRPGDFIGLHFFSPVRKMPLVEIICGERTSEEALARAFDVVRQINKTPIVVNDARGFFTSRVIGTFLNEAAAMLDEGVNPASIEQAGLQAGYPAAPLKLFDELTLTLPLELAREARRAAEQAGEDYDEHPGESVLRRMVEDFDRRGKAAGAGFYTYPEDTDAHLWEGLLEHFTDAGEPSIPFEDLQERMLFAEALETVRCFDEGVITSVADANIGSIFGIGFPAWTGGVAQYIDQYAGIAGGEDERSERQPAIPRGTTGFVARAKELADRYGDRFVPPASLTRLAERGESFRSSV